MEDETMDIVVPEDEVVIASAEKIVADLKKFDDSTVRQFHESKFPKFPVNFPVANVKLLGTSSDLAALPTAENKTFLVPYMEEAALVTADADITVECP
jgi:hypothetical protein